ncbi:hypothetical protein, partial [Agromyces binzhouensis]|uniref:hypothetical protein n=1 Tax=Agromyces binzhouensis TaxID=1817495 RepID=UPI0013ED24B0
PTPVVGGVPGAEVAPRDAGTGPQPVGSDGTAPMGFEVPRRTRGLPVSVAAIVTVLVLGVGGAALAFGVATLSGNLP